MKKRLLSLLLTAAMVLSMLPTTAFAAEDGSDFVVGDTTTVSISNEGNIVGKVDWVDGVLTDQMNVTLLLLPSYQNSAGNNGVLAKVTNKNTAPDYLTSGTLGPIKGETFTGPAYIKYIKGNGTEQELNESLDTWTPLTNSQSAVWGLPTAENLDQLYETDGALAGNISNSVQDSVYPYTLVVFCEAKSQDQGVYQAHFDIKPAKSPAVLTPDKNPMAITVRSSMTDNVLKLANGGNNKTATGITAKVTGDMAKHFNVILSATSVAESGFVTATINLLTTASDVKYTQTGALEIEYKSDPDDLSVIETFTVPVTALKGTAAYLTAPAKVAISTTAGVAGTTEVVILNAGTAVTYTATDAAFKTASGTDVTGGFTKDLSGGSYSGMALTATCGVDNVESITTDNTFADGATKTVTLTMPIKDEGTHEGTLVIPYIEDTETGGVLTIPITLTVTTIPTTPLTDVKLTGTEKVEQTLTATVAPTGATANYVWTRSDNKQGTNSTTLTGNSNQYTLVPADVGKYITVAATGTGLYSGTVSATTDAVADKDKIATKATISAITGEYTGSAHTPTITVTTADGVTPVVTLTPTTDYTVSWDPAGLTDADTYTATIALTASAKATYSAPPETITYKITEQALPVPTLTRENPLTNNGTEGSVTITNHEGLAALDAGVTYTISSAQGTWNAADHKWTGLGGDTYTVTAVATANGNYSNSSAEVILTSPDASTFTVTPTTLNLTWPTTGKLTYANAKGAVTTNGNDAAIAIAGVPADGEIVITPMKVGETTINIVDAGNARGTEGKTIQVKIIVSAKALPTPTLEATASTAVSGNDGTIKIKNLDSDFGALSDKYKFQINDGADGTYADATVTDGVIGGLTGGRTYKVKAVSIDADHYADGPEASVLIPQPIKFSVTVNTSLDAGHFAEDTVVTLTPNGGGTAYTGKLTSGSVIIADVPNGTYAITVAGATGGGNVTVDNANVTATTLAYYNFELTVDANGTRGAGATAKGIYISGTTLNTTITANAGYIFDKWTDTTSDGGTVTAPGTLTAATHLYANFKAAAPTLGDLTKQSVTYGDAASTYVVPDGGWESGATAGTITYSATDVPDGVTFDAATQTFTIRPTAVNTTGTTVTVKAANSVDLTKFAEKTFSIIVNKATPTLTLTSGGSHDSGAATATAVTATGTVTYHDGTNWVTVTDGDISAIGAVTYDPATLVKGTTQYMGILKINDKYKESLNGTTNTVTVTLNASHDITVNINKNGEPWNDRTGAIVLTDTTKPAKTFSGTLAAGTGTIVGVPNGTYTLSWAGVDVKTPIAVTADATETVNYYEVATDATLDKSVASIAAIAVKTGAEVDGAYLVDSVLTLDATPVGGYNADAVTWNDATLTDKEYKVVGKATLKPVFDANAVTGFAAGALSGTYNTAWGASGSITGAAVAGGSIKYTTAANAMPEGLTLNADGTISGTPTTAYPTGATKTVAVTATAYDANGVATGVSDAKDWTFTIAKGTQTAPTLTGTDCDIYDAADGTLTIGSYTGTSGNYEWSADGTDWMLSAPGTPDASGKITGVAAGTYHVRLKGTANLDPSAAAGPVVVAAGSNFYGKVTVKLDSGTDYSTKITGVKFGTVAATVGADGLWTSDTKLAGSNNAAFQVIVTTTEDVTITGNTVSADSQTGTEVNFYTVKIGTVTMPTGSTKTAPTIVDNSTTGYADGSVVLAGTTVTFKLKDDTTVMVTNDYDIDSWGGSATGSTATATVEYDGVKDDVTAALKRNTYTVTGLAGTGIDTLSIGGTAVDGVAVDAISGAVTTAGTANGAKFDDVPAGTYTILATLKPENIISGDSASDNPLDGVGVSRSSLADKFNYPTTGNTYTIEISEDATITTGGEDTYTYGYTTITTRTVSIKNNGNSDLANFGVTMDNGTNFKLGNIIGLAEGTLKAGQTATVTVKILASQNATDTSGYTTTLTVKGEKLTSTAKTYTYKAVVNKATPAAPTLSNAVKPTTIGGSDGKLTITVYSSANTYQITGKGGTSWADIPATDITSAGIVSGLAAGTYQVRIKSDANHNDGTESNELAVPAGTNYAGQVTVLVDGGTSSKIVSVAFKTAGGASVPATGVNGVYTTAAKALDTDSGVYTVYVTVSRNGANVEPEISGSTVNGGGAIAVATAVDFYSVGFDAKATIVNKGTGTLTSDSAPAVTAAIAGGGSALLSGDVVLKGNTVDFAIASYTGHDYAPSWNQKITGTTNTGSKQYNGKVGTVTPTLTQNTYEVTGTVGNIAQVTAVTLTEKANNGKVFNGAKDTNAKTYSFDVPKGSYAIGYTLAEECVYESEGSSIPNPLTIAAQNLTAFIINSKGSSYSLSVSDGTNTASADPTDPGTTTNTMTAVTWNDENPTQIVVSVKNTGNEPLKNVTVTATPSAEANFTVTSTNFPTDGTTLAANETRTFTIDAVVKGETGMPAGSHTVAVVVNAKTDSIVPGNQTLKTATYNVSLTVNKAEIASAAVTGVTTPAAGGADQTVIANAPVGNGSTAVSWSPALTDNKFAPGTVYTVTVTLTPDGNHTYTDAATGTIDGTGAGTATGGVLTLTKTFAPTAPTLTAELEATGFGTATAKFTVGAQSGATTKIKYLVSDTEKTAENVVAAGTEITGTSASITGLTPNTAYKIYAVATTSVGGVDSASTLLVTSAAENTWYKVVTAFTGHNGASDGTPTMTPATTAESSVKGGTTLAINAVIATDKTWWKFDEWTASPAVGTVPAKGTAGGNFTAPPATGNGTNGTNGTITLTAAFVGAELTVTSNYGTTGTYGAAYTGTAPKVDNGSGTYTYTLIAPVTRATNGLPAGLTLNANGTITGIPEAVGTYTFAVEVTDTVTGKTAKTDDVTLVVAAATPVLTTGYADGPYYNGNTVDANLLTTGTFTGPKVKSKAVAPVLTGSTWADVEITGTWSFNGTTAEKTYGKGDTATGTYNYSVTFTPTDTAKYDVEMGTVSIASTGKSYTIAISKTSSPDPFSAEYTSAEAGEAKTTFTVTNNGNQTANMTYVLGGTNAANFALDKTTNATLAPGAASADTVVLSVVAGATLVEGTYTATVTIKDGNDPAGKQSVHDISFVVTPKQINAANITNLTAPVKGGSPDSDVTSDAVGSNYTVTSVAWTPTVAAGEKFAAGTKYTVTIVLTADANHTFVSGTYKLGDTTANLTATADIPNANEAGNTATLTYTYPATAAGAIKVTAQPINHISGKITEISTPSSVPVEFYYLVSNTEVDETAIKASTTHVTGTVTEGVAAAKNITVPELSEGTTYKVYVLEKIGTTWGATKTVSLPFTTDYKITVTAPANGTVSPNGIFYVKAGTTRNMTATAASGYEWKSWTLNPTTAGSTISQQAVDAVLTPKENLTVAATFDGLPNLEVTGEPYGNQVAQGYNATTINVYLKGKIANIGIGGMVDKLAARVVARNAAFGADLVDTFTAEFLDTALTAGTSTPLAVHPKAGLTTTTAPNGVHTATIWIYEIGREAAAKSIDVSIVIIPAGDPAFVPIEKNWDLKEGATNEAWVIEITENGAVPGEPTRGGAALTGTDYAYTDGSGSTLGKKILTLSKTYLDTLAAESGRKAGDKVEIVVPAVTGGNTKNTTLTLTYVDTTPTVTSVKILPNAGFASGDLLTATAEVSNGAAITAGQVTYKWYHTAVAQENELQAGNANTYTVLPAQAGKLIIVEAVGNGTNFKGSKNDTTTATGYNITVNVPAVGSEVPGIAVPTSAKVPFGGSVELSATEKPGFRFIGWNITAVGGALGNGETLTDSVVTVTPSKDGTITASFIKLPVLTISQDTYDASSGSGDTEPVLTYTRNGGVHSKFTISGPGILLRDMGTDDFAAGAPTLGTDGNYTLSATLLATLTAGSYTITAVDVTAAYSEAVTLNVNKNRTPLTGVTIGGTVECGQTLTATPAPSGATATYKWFYSGTGTGAWQEITGETNATYELPADGNIALGGKTVNLSNSYLKVTATGTGNYSGEKSATTTKIPALEYTVTVDWAGTGNATGQTAVRNLGFTAEKNKTVDDVKHGDSFAIDAKANGTYVFTGWTITAPGTGVFGDTTGTTSTNTFAPTSNVTIVAHFAQKMVSSITIDGITPPSKGGTPDPDTSGVSTVDYTVEQSVVWTPNDLADGKFKPSTSYVATVIITPATDVDLAPGVSVTVIGGGTGTVRVDQNDKTKWIVTITYPATAGEGGGPIIPPGGGGESTAFTVTYDLRDLGTTKDKTTESVVSGKKPAAVPTVVASKGLTFKGWSLDNPAKVKEPKLVNPKTVTVKEDTTFYAVYDGHIIGEHEHYIKGLPDGTFGPAMEITRAEVATIIARACLSGFVESKNEGNGGYPDIDGHWAQSAIAFCTSKGIFVGQDDGRFNPDRNITRQEFAMVFARLAGLKKTGDMPFSDIGTAGDWAVDGIYTAYVNGWVDGYTDGTFKPLNNIARSEAVKIVNAYLHRGVDATGITDIAGIKGWPDVSETYWAYYDILEASNDHTYYYADEKKPPEIWLKASIEKANWDK